MKRYSRQRQLPTADAISHPSTFAMGLLMQTFGYSNAEMLQGATTQQLSSAAQAAGYADVHRYTLYQVSPEVLAQAADEVAIANLIKSLSVLGEGQHDFKQESDAEAMLREAAAMQSEVRIDKESLDTKPVVAEAVAMQSEMPIDKKLLDTEPVVAEAVAMQVEAQAAQVKDEKKSVKEGSQTIL